MYKKTNHRNYLVYVLNIKVKQMPKESMNVIATYH